MDPRQRSEEPSCWFNDGTVVLQAEHTLFKVYKGILARESEVFRTMLSLPQPATLSDSEKYGDCQLVVLQDKAEDIVTFIRVINDYNFLAECRSSSVYATLLILSAKYQCTHLRRRVMKPLRSTFQDTSFVSSVSNWSSFSTGVKLAEWADITMIANAALDSKTHILLPSILLTGFRQKITTLLEGAPRLEAGGLNALLKATPRLSSRARKVVFAELFDPGTAIPRGCKTEDKRLSTRRVITRDIEVAENVFDPFHMTYRYSSSSSSPLSAEKLCPTRQDAGNLADAPADIWSRDLGRAAEGRREGGRLRYRIVTDGKQRCILERKYIYSSLPVWLGFDSVTIGMNIAGRNPANNDAPSPKYRGE